MVVHHPQGAGVKAFRRAETVAGIRHDLKALGADARNRLNEDKNKKQNGRIDEKPKFNRHVSLPWAPAAESTGR
jgi:hypothetical protein